MDNRKVLYDLLYNALINIREEAYTIGNKRIFGLADFVHNLPSMLEMAGDDKQKLDAILKELEIKAEHDGYKSWLDRMKDQTRS
jgi:hypothetical protein